MRRQPFTYVRAVFNPPLGIGLRATTAGGFDGLLGRAEGEDVPIDEQGFRGVFRVTARDGSLARFLLGPEIIREMMKLNEIYAGVVLADELVQIKMSDTKSRQNCCEAPSPMPPAWRTASAALRILSVEVSSWPFSGPVRRLLSRSRPLPQCRCG